jgi:uncharacterized phage-associated protein
MATSALAVSNKFLDIAWGEGNAITPMQLQKLVYFAHGWHLALFDNALISEPVRAWRYGPVIKSVYNKFKEFGNNSITKKATDLKYFEERGEFVPVVPVLIGENKEVVVNRVWKVYGKYDGIQLSNITHQPGSPWSQVVAKYNNDPPLGLTIPDDLIKDYFKNQVRAT